MKKFFSILCALTIVLSVSAAPAQILGKSKHAEALEMKAVKADSPFKAFPAKSLMKADRLATSLKRAPKAKQQDYTITIESYAEKYYSADNDVYVRLFDADGNTYYFDIVVAEGSQELELNHAYTLADMLPNYSYKKDSLGNKTVYASASLTKSLVAYEEQQLVHIDAAFADSLGNIYMLTYEEAPFIITGDTIDIFFQEHMDKPIFAQNMCQLRTKNDSMDIAFTFNVATEGSAAGIYSEADMNLTYTFVNDLVAKSAHCIVSELNGNIALEGWILAGDGNVYHVTMFFEIPTPQSQENITCTNLVLDESLASWFGIIVANASNDDYSVSMYLSAEDYVGTFDAEEVELTIKDANGEIELYQGSVTVAVSNGGYVITGSALSMDGVEYILNLSYVAPEPTSQETLTMSGVITNYGTAWQFRGVAGNNFLTIAAYSATIPNTYGPADLAADYTYVMKLVGGDTLYYDMVDANINVAVSGTNATITGTLRGQNYVNSADVIEFTLNLTATVEDYEPGGDEYDAQDEDFIRNFPEYTIDDQYLAEYNVLIAEATDAENYMIAIEFNVEAGATELATGVYNIDASGEPGTVYAGYVNSGSIYGSVAGILNEGGALTSLWLLNAGTVTVLENGVIEVQATNTWGRAINCRLGEYPEGIENTDAKAAAVKVVRDGKLIIIKNGVEFNAQGTIVK